MTDLLDDFELIPAEDTSMAADDQLAAAEAEALEDPLSAGEDEVLIPYGRTWSFDFQARRFIRSGTGGAVEVSGENSLKVWALTALHTARGAHASLGEDFGFEDPDDFIGEASAELAMVNWEDRAREALTQHDRVADLDDVDYEVDPMQGIVFLHEMTIVTDEVEAVPLGDFELQPEV